VSQDVAEALPDEVRNAIGYQLRRAHTLFAQHWQLLCRDRGGSVTPMQAGMLLTIARRPGLTQAALAKAMAVEAPTLQQALDRLEANGLVRRARRPGDRRSHALELTEAGEATLGELRRYLVARDAALLADLGEAERATLLALLQRVVRQAEALATSSSIERDVA